MVYREYPYNSTLAESEMPYSQNNMKPYNNNQAVSPVMATSKSPTMSPAMAPTKTPALSPEMSPSKSSMSPMGTASKSPGMSQGMQQGTTPAMMPGMTPGMGLPSGVPSGPPYGGSTISSAGAPLQSGVPQTVQNPYYTAGFLKNFIGRDVRVEFLVGSSGPLVDRIGTLLDVGASYIVIKPIRSNDQLMCDLYSIKFVTIYGGPL